MNNHVNIEETSAKTNTIESARTAPVLRGRQFIFRGGAMFFVLNSVATVYRKNILT
jgi:hypothetical protein